MEAASVSKVSSHDVNHTTDTSSTRYFCHLHGITGIDCRQLSKCRYLSIAFNDEARLASTMLRSVGNKE